MTQTREQTPPFLVKVFYRTNAFHRLEEFMDPLHLPPWLDLHTWKDCTLKELTELIADATPNVLPHPAVGTRLVFRLIYRENRDQQKFAANEMGTLVIGEGRPGANPGAPPNPDRLKTLAEARFITGDYISCAILPPDEYTGEVVPASAAKEGRGSGIGEAGAGSLPLPIPATAAAAAAAAAGRIPTRPRVPWNNNSERSRRGGGGGHGGFGDNRGNFRRGFATAHSTWRRPGKGVPDGDWVGGIAGSNER